MSVAVAIFGVLLTGAPNVAVEDFSAICLSQVRGFEGAQVAARNRGWMEDGVERANSAEYGSLVGPGLPFRRLTYDTGARSGSTPSCSFLLRDSSCERIHALADSVEARMGRPPTSWDELNCEAVWRLPTSARVVVVGTDGHALTRLMAFDDIQMERAQ